TAKSFAGSELRSRGASVLFREADEVLPQALAIARALCEKPLHPLKVLKRELSGRILDRLNEIVGRELDMHMETFTDPEVTRRLEFYFKPTEVSSAQTTPLAASEAPLPSTGSEPADSAKPRQRVPELVGAELRSKLAAAVARVLHLPASELKGDVSFRDLGVDSITGVEIVRELNDAFRLNLDAVAIYNYPTPTILAAHIADEQVKRETGSRSDHDAGTLSRAPLSRAEADPLCPPDSAMVAEAAVRAAIARVVGQVLHLPEEELSGEVSFRDLGVDSITGVEIVRELNAEFRLNLDAVAIYNYPTPERLAGQLCAELGRIGDSGISKTACEATVRQPETLAQAVRLENLAGGEKRPGPAPISLRKPGASGGRAAETVAPRQVQLRKKPHSGATRESLSSPEPRESAHAEPSGEMATDGSRRAQRGGDIAVVGMSGRFPGAKDLHEFWGHLRDGLNSIVDVPGERWEVDRFYDPTPQKPDKTYSKRGGFIDAVDKFDTLFFRISPQEAEMMDPQQRIFLEESWNALEDAGYPEQAVQEMCCGIFFGAPASDYRKLLAQAGVESEADAFTGMAPCVLAGRLAYFLNLNGPCITLDTACSSSLVAIHQACQSLAQGECEMALAGGVTLMLTEDLMVKTSQIGMMSASGQCRVFDQRADGAVFSEGIGVIVLKPLEKAQADGDFIYGVIKGSGINQDGRTNGITAPNGNAQRQLESSVYRRFDIDPEKIGYVETHGTGTKLGDPIEVKALTEAFREFTPKKGFCAIGSVKANIGHTSMAAGVAGVIKVLLAMQHRQLPPAINFHQANEHIDFGNSPFFVNTDLQAWRVPAHTTRLAAVSSFGFSGTNCHMVLEEAPQRLRRSARRRSLQLAVLSGKTQEALRQRFVDLAAWLDSHPDACLEDVVYTLQIGRTHFPLRAALLVSDIEALRRKLGSLAGGLVAEECAKEAIHANSGSAIPPHAVRTGEVARLLESLGQTSADKTLRNDLEALARLYVEGQEVDWQRLYETDEGRRVPLPGYPFARERYWIASREAEPGGSRIEPLHPLLERNVSTLHEQCFTTRLRRDAFFLADHIVNGSQLLPGACYVEMARAAVELSLHKPVLRLRDLAWLRPVILTDALLELRIELFAEDQGIEFEIRSGDGAESCLHAQGSVQVGDVSARRVQTLDFPAIRERCRQRLEIDGCYRDAEARGLRYGPGFQVLRQLYGGTGEAWAELALPSHLESHGDFLLHPSLLDGALQTLMGVERMRSATHALYLPFAVSGIEIFEALPKRCFSYVRSQGETEQEAGLFDLWLLDETGRVLVALKEYRVKALPEPMENELDDEALLALFAGLQRGEIELSEAEQRVVAGGSA
ncbi:MAG: beta-ketoacyl synthase N-terminal-like domain-containing protein, partial [Candidatus Thiodiazotropha sp.]